MTVDAKLEYRIAYSDLADWRRIAYLEGLGWEPFATTPGGLLIWRKRVHVSSGTTDETATGQPVTRNENESGDKR